MVSEDLKMGTKKVGSPFLQCLDDGKKFFLMNRVVFLSIVELVGIICNRAAVFQVAPKLSTAPVQQLLALVVT